MKQTLIAALCGVAAIVFAALWITKETAPAPADPAPATDDSSQAIADLHRDLAAMKSKLGNLEVENANLRRRVEANQAEAERRLAAAAEPTTEASAPEVGATDPDPAADEPKTREEQIGAAVAAFIGDLTNVIVSTTNGASGVFGGEIEELWRDQDRIESKRRVAQEYGDLLSRFDLTLEDRETFLNLLAERGGRRGPWARGPRAEERRAEAEAEIRDFLGDEGYREYQNFEETKYARKRVNEFAAELGEGLALQPAQKDAMIGLFDGLDEFNREFQRNAWSGIQKEGDEAAATMDNQLDKLQAHYNGIITDAADVLDKPQLEALSTHLNTNLQRAEKQIEMGQAWRRRMEEGGGELFKLLREGGGEAGIEVQVEEFSPDR